MNFVKQIIRRPVTILVLFTAVFLFGISAYLQIPVAFFPEVDPPVLMINTSYADAGPREVEESVTKPLEAALASVSGLESLTSTSTEGSSQVVLDLQWETDLTEATNDVRDILDRVKAGLPDGAEDPRIFKMDPSSRPIMTIALSGNREPEELRLIAEEDMQASLERVVGVAEADIRGGRDEVVAVELDASALAAYGLSVSGVARSIGAANSEASGGTITVDGRLLLVRSSGEFSSLEELENAVVGYAGSAGNQRPISLKEVGSAAFDYEDATSLVRVNGKPAVSISITAESDANTVQVADLVYKTLDSLAGVVPSDVELNVTKDSSSATRDTLDQITSSLLLGAVFAIGVLLFFLHNFRAALIIGVGVPISLSATLLAMSFAGLTLNLLSMSGLILGIGMIVDSSIVVLENIDRHRREGQTLHDAAALGTGEMITPIVASALTTVSVFVPVLVFRDELGIMGILLGDIAFVIIVGILSALAVAALLVPVLASTWIPLHGYGGERRGLFARLGDFIARGLEAADNLYARALRASLRRRAVVLAVAAALFIVTVSFVPQLGFIFSPPTAEDDVSVTITLREGTELEETDRVAGELASWIRDNIEIAENIVVQSGDLGSSGRGGGSANTATIDVGLPSILEAKYDTREIQNRIRQEVANRPGIELDFGENMGMQLSGGDPIDIVVQSDDLDAATVVAIELRDLLKDQFPEVTEPSTDLANARPELLVEVNHARAADLGVSIADITSEIRASFSGTTATRYNEKGTEWDVSVSIAEAQRRDIADLEAISVRGSSGTAVPISNLATVSIGQGPTEINREEERRTVHITGGLQVGAVVSEVTPRIKAAIAESVDVPEHVRVQFSGELGEINETGAQMAIVLAVAILLVFAIMASQFESFRAPFIIFFVIPLMFIGAVGIYVLVGESISMFSLVGLVVLAGIVVNNGIVLVDYTNLLRTRGYEIFDAALEAGKTRFKPILMTTFTTILGMTPLAFFPGEGGQLTQPVGLTVVGGLTTSALMSLFVVPVLYTYLAPKRVEAQDEELV